MLCINDQSSEVSKVLLVAGWGWGGGPGACRPGGQLGGEEVHLGLCVESTPVGKCHLKVLGLHDPVCTVGEASLSPYCTDILGRETRSCN